ncbi:pseudaminic acid cytidylyltransferase [Rhabdothermincola salaria]|uniref:pseudaminic acid cytidylyltransferase n=1 Tax=Rhabdothermincola salaria TaxID=2903142 RepID=UPI001E509BA3|nr:pseudaminic acid cytidylyltransferase [Rhabdothermincola salaria]
MIPARGGSKRIPRKNIRPFHGLPLIVRPIQTALRSQLFRDVVVSTDDDEIAAVAEEAGAAVPFSRDSTLADDFTPLQPVVADAIDKYSRHTTAEITHVCLIYPAAVFTLAKDLAESLALLCTSGAELVFSACAHPAPVHRAWQQDESNSASMIWPEYRLTRSQDLPEAYFDCGQFAWGTRTYWAHPPRKLQTRTALYVLPRERAHDIDTEVDWHLAEVAFSHYRSEAPQV